MRAGLPSDLLDIVVLLAPAGAYIAEHSTRPSQVLYRTPVTEHKGAAAYGGRVIA